MAGSEREHVVDTKYVEYVVYRSPDAWFWVVSAEAWGNVPVHNRGGREEVYRANTFSEARDLRDLYNQMVLHTTDYINRAFIAME